MLRIVIDCQRCGKKVGTAKVSVALQGWNTSNHATTNQRFLNVDSGDLEYWQKQHSQESCNAEIDLVRARVDAERTAQGEANAQG